jgi:hypothetical protein
MLPTFAAVAIAVPIALMLRIAGMGMCVSGHDSDRVSPANQPRKGERLKLGIGSGLKRGKVQ